MKILSILSILFLVSCNGSKSGGESKSLSDNTDSVEEFNLDIESLVSEEYHTACVNGANTYYKYIGNGRLEVKYNRYEENDCIDEYANIPMLSGTFDMHVIEYDCTLDGNILTCNADVNYYVWMVDHFNIDINTWDVMSCIDDHANLNLQGGAPNYEDGDCPETSAQFALSGSLENLVINGQQLTRVVE